MRRWYFQKHSQKETEKIRKAYAEGKIAEHAGPYVINSGLVPIPRLKFETIAGWITSNWSYEIKTAWLEANGIEWDKSKGNCGFVTFNSVGVDQALEEYAQDGESPPFVWWPNKYPTRRDLVGDAFFFESLQKVFRENGTFSHYKTSYGS